MDTDSGQGSAWASANDAERRANEALALLERLGQVVFDFVTGGHQALGEAEMSFLRDLSARCARRENARIANEKAAAEYRQSEEARFAAQMAAGLNGGLGSNFFNGTYRNRA